MWRPARLTRAGAVALIALVACTPPPLPPPDRELTLGIVGDPGSLLSEDPSARVVAALVIEPLVRRTATEDLEPRLAERVPSFENGDLAVVEDPGTEARLVATFRLREGLRWHDGAPITAEDVRFAFDDDRAAPSGSEARSVADRVERVDVEDPRTLRVTYRAGERWELYALAPRALPRHLLAGATAQARERYASAPVHAGPYRIVDRVAGSHVTLVAFAGHAIDRPSIERIVVRSYPDRVTLLGAVRRGEIDVAPSPAFDADLARTLDRSADGSSAHVLYTPAQSIAMLRFGPLFSDPALRQAVALAVDRERIARSVFAGRVRLPASYLVPPLWAASPEGPAARPDREAARALLARAGLRRGSFGIVEREGRRLVATLLVPAGSAGMEDAARAVAVDLAAIGIAADVSARPLAEIEQRVLRGGFDLALVPERADDPLASTERYRGTVSPWFDALGDAARAADGRADKRLLYGELQRLWAERPPAVPLYQILKVDVVPARLEGVRPAAHAAALTWNAGDWRPVQAR